MQAKTMRTIGIVFRMTCAVIFLFFIVISFAPSTAAGIRFLASPQQGQKAPLPTASETSPKAVTEGGGGEAMSSMATSSVSFGAGAGGESGATMSAPSSDAYVFTGAATTSIPIIVAPGRGGIAPNLTIQYNSYRDNSWVGRGWDLDLGAIRRSTKYEVDYSTDDYVVVKDGSHRELAARSDWGADYYSAKIEGEFARYYLNPSTGGWEVTAKDGTTYFYGTTADSRQDNANGIFQWCLDRVEDVNGNYLTVTYTKDQGEIYPQQINYTGHTTGLAPTNYVRFYLEDRPDQPTMFTTNAGVTAAKRLKSIEVVANSSLVRAYQLTYTESEGTARSLLASVQQFGSDATIDANGAISGSTSLPPIACQYTAEATAFAGSAYWGTPSYIRHEMVAAMPDLNGDKKADYIYQRKDTRKMWAMLSTEDGLDPATDTLWGEREYEFALVQIGMFLYYITAGLTDVNGDGMFDLVYQRAGSSRELRVMLSTGDSFEPDISWGTKLYSSKADEIRGEIVDMNGDGKADLVYQRAGTNELWVKLSTGTEFGADELWGTKSYGTHYNSVWSFVDMNGDGKADLFYRSAGTDDLRVMLSTGDGFGPDISWGTRPSDASEVIWTLADMNGDGKVDYVYQRGYTPEIWVMLSTGTGFGPQTMWGSRSFSIGGYGWDGISGSLWTLDDMNGDGKADFFYQANNTNDLRVMLSTGTEFGDDTLWGTKPYDTYYDYYSQYNYYLFWIWMYFDVTGDGKTEPFYQRQGTTEMHIMKSDPDKTMLLSSITNSQGATTTFEYTTSSECPDTRLPFVLHPVSRITVDVNDDLNHQSATTYTYQGGLYDVTEREFRGFECVVATDEVTGMVTETHYHQDRVFQGRVAWSETRDSTGAAVGRVENTWEAFDYGEDRAFPYIEQSIATKYDAAGASLGTITTAYTYDEAYGNPLTEQKTTTDGYSRFAEMQYLNDTTNWIIGKPENVQVREGPGSAILRETRMQYTNDSRRLLERQKRVHNGAEYTTVYEYDTYGNVTLITNPRSIQTFIEYDGNGMFPIRTVNDYNGLNHEVEKTFDPRFGVVLTEIDVNDQIIAYTYDEFGREIYVDYPDPSWKETIYHIEPGNHYVIVRASDAPEGTTFYDNLGRTIEEQLEANGTTIATATQYDSAGRVERKSLPFFEGGTAEYTTYEYDLRSRLIRQTKPDTTYQRILYNGLQETVIDENNHSKVITQDLLGRVKQVDQAIGGYAQYTYDIFDNLVEVQDPIGNQTTITYDDLGRKIAINDPYMGNWGYNYDEVDNLVWQKNGRDQEVVLQYDGLNRVFQKAYLTTNRQVVYTYDEPRSGYYNKGGLTTVAVTSETPQITTEYNYDQMGQPVAETRSIDSTAYDFSRSYDLAGRLSSVTYPDGTQVDYAYYPIGDLKEVIKNGSSTPYALYEGYNALGQVGRVDYGNGTRSIYTYYTQTYRIETMTTRDGSDAIIQSLSYGYDNVGNIMSITDSLNSVTQTFDYDEVDRLTQAMASTSDLSRKYDLTYTYDVAGNMLAKTDNNSSGIGWQVVDQDAVGRPTSIDYGHAIADIGDRHVDYNEDNRPTRIVFRGNETNLFYDGENVRIKKVSGSSTIIYAGGLYEERNGVPTLHVFAEAKRIVSIEGTETYYYHTDHLNSTTVVTDAGGNRVEELGYLPYGSLLYLNAFQGGQWSTVYRFTGQEYDAEYALYNYNARLYDPIIGRFISPDPFIQDPYNPQNLNRYTYCLNNPLIYVDPTGNFFGAIGGFFSGIFNSIFGGGGLDSGGSDWGGGSNSWGSGWGGLSDLGSIWNVDTNLGARSNMSSESGNILASAEGFSWRGNSDWGHDFIEILDLPNKNYFEGSYVSPLAFYDVSAGSMKAFTSHLIYSSTGWVSGLGGACQNNPSYPRVGGDFFGVQKCPWIKDVGPAPPGPYTETGRPKDSPETTTKRTLTPTKNHRQMYGRGGIQTHWCPDIRDCSTGCLAHPSQVEIQVWNLFVDRRPNTSVIVVP